MKKRGKGIALSYTNTVLNMICGLFLSAFFIRTLGKTEYGVYKTISTFANYLVLFQFGTGTVMTRNLSICRSKGASKDEIEKNVSTIWSITNILAIGILLVSLIFYASIDVIYSNSFSPAQIIYGKQIFVFITGFLLSSFYLQTLNGITLAYEYYSFSAAVNIVKIIIRTILLVGLLLSFKHAIIIAIIDMLLTMIICIYTYWFCKKKCKTHFTFKHFSSYIFKASLPLCLAIFLQTIVNQANSNVDNFIIGIKMNPESVTIYSVALYIYSIFSSLTTIPITMYAPQVAKDMTNGLRERGLADSLIQPSRLIVLIGGSILFGFIAVGRQFVWIFYGSQYEIAWTIGIILMTPMFLNMSNGIIVNVLDVLNKRIARSGILIITTVANIIMTLIFLDIWGVMGAAIATAISTLLGQVILMNLYYNKVIKIPVFYMLYRIFKGILPFQILAMVVSLFIGHFISNIYVSFIICGLLFVIVFLAAFIALGANKEEKRIYMSVISKMRKRND